MSQSNDEIRSPPEIQADIQTFLKKNLDKDSLKILNNFRDELEESVKLHGDAIREDLLDLEVEIAEHMQHPKKFTNEWNNHHDELIKKYLKIQNPKVFKNI